MLPRRGIGHANPCGRCDADARDGRGRRGDFCHRPASMDRSGDLICSINRPLAAEALTGHNENIAKSRSFSGMGRKRQQPRSRQPDRPPQPQNAPDVRERRLVWAVCGGLLLIVAAVFGQTLGFEFVNLDDPICIRDNVHVHHGLSGEAVYWAFTERYAGCWIPLTWLSHEFDCQVYGLHPWGHHLTNVLLHAAATILLVLTLRSMTGRAGTACGNGT